MGLLKVCEAVTQMIICSTTAQNWKAESHEKKKSEFWKRFQEITKMSVNNIKFTRDNVYDIF